MKKSELKLLIKEEIKNILSEKWKNTVEIRSTGEHTNKTIVELEKELKTLKGKHPYDRELAGELMFAIRAKRHFKGGVTKKKIIK